MDGLVTPLQDRIEEWKKTTNQLDKDHAKGEPPADSHVHQTSGVRRELNVEFFTPQNTNGLVRKSRGSRWTPSSCRRKPEKVRDPDLLSTVEGLLLSSGAI